MINKKSVKNTFKNKNVLKNNHIKTFSVWYKSPFGPLPNALDKIFLKILEKNIYILFRKFIPNTYIYVFGINLLKNSLMKITTKNG